MSPRRASAAWRSACPMSSSTFRPARPRASPSSTPRSSVRPRASTRRAIAGGAGRGRPRAGAGVPRDRGEVPAYDGHHIQVYVANFSGPHRKLLERSLVTEESNQYQYRFEIITDRDSGKPLFQIEHEIRSMRHPLYARPLVNRNPAADQPQLRGRAATPGCPMPMVEEMDDPRDARRQTPHRGRGSPAHDREAGLECPRPPEERHENRELRSGHAPRPRGRSAGQHAGGGGPQAARSSSCACAPTTASRASASRSMAAR